MTVGPVDASAVQAALAAFPDPETGRSALGQQQIRDVNLSDGKLSLTLALTTWAAPIADEVQQTLEDELRAKFPQLREIRIRRAVMERPSKPLGDIGVTVKSVIAVGSGKGGVGKSTMAASLAIGLQRSGAKVGLMDADVYGPSIPHLLGAMDSPTVINNRIQPILVNGMPVMSMGFLVPPGEAVVWRGPMLHGAITQFLRDTEWGELDYLIIDMPPGTGDVALTLSQLLPLTGAVVVCTPQDVALLDAVKAIAMFRKVNIRVLGMVENMSGFICPDCNRRYDIFGSGGARQRAESLDVPFLGDVPIVMKYRELGDAGRVADSFSDPNLAAPLDAVCRRLVGNLAKSAAECSSPVSLPILD
jgi:ATP-binding protein involved in chromosome partitioning